MSVGNKSLTEAWEGIRDGKGVVRSWHSFRYKNDLGFYTLKGRATLKRGRGAPMVVKESGLCQCCYIVYVHAALHLAFKEFGTEYAKCA